MYQYIWDFHGFFEVRKLTEIYSLLKEWGKISFFFFKKKFNKYWVDFVQVPLYCPSVSSISCCRSVQRLNGAGRPLPGNQCCQGDSIAVASSLLQYRQKNFKMVFRCSAAFTAVGKVDMYLTWATETSLAEVINHWEILRQKKLQCRSAEPWWLSGSGMFLQVNLG